MGLRSFDRIYEASPQLKVRWTQTAKKTKGENTLALAA
jgi:hypothetical protein